MSNRGPADFAWATAEVHLAEAAAQDAEVTPLTTAHSAYYAMFHAALAVLLRESGSFPKKHDSVIRQFSFLVKDLGSAHRQAAEDLNDVKDLRIEADYSQERYVSPTDARRALEKTTAFLDLCAKEFGFPRARESGNG